MVKLFDEFVSESILGRIQRRDLKYGQDREIRAEDRIEIEYHPESMDELKRIIFNKVHEKSFDGYLEMRDVDVSNINNLTNAFSSLSYSEDIKEINVKGWDTSGVLYMMRCFSGCTEVKNIIGLDTWDVSNVLVMGSMFFRCESLKSLDIENWNVENVQDMSYMFLDCGSLERLDLEKWNLRDKVITKLMFKECPIGYEIVDGHFERYRLP